MRQKMEYRKMAGRVTPCHLLIPLRLNGRSGCERHINFEKCRLGCLRSDKVLTGTSDYTHSIPHICKQSLKTHEDMIFFIVSE